MGALQSMSETELRWLLAGVGLIILVLIWLISRRRTKAGRQENGAAPTLESALTAPADQAAPADDKSEYHFGEFGAITPEHHLADKALVDVEIIPLGRSDASRQQETPAATLAQDYARATGRVSAETAAEEGTQLQSRQETIPDTVEPPTAAGRSGRRPGLTIVLTITAPLARPFRGPSILLAAQELKLKLHKSGVFDFSHPRQPKGNPVFSIGQLHEPGTFDLDDIGRLATPGLLLYMRLPGTAAPLEAVDLLIQTARELAQKLGGTVCDEHRERMSGQAYIKLRNDAATLEKQLGLP